MAGEHKNIWLVSSPEQSDDFVGAGFNFTDLWDDTGHQCVVDPWVLEGMWFWSWQDEPNQKKPVDSARGQYYVVTQIPMVGLALVAVPHVVVPKFVKAKSSKLRNQLLTEIRLAEKQDDKKDFWSLVVLEWEGAVAGRIRRTKARRISGN